MELPEKGIYCLVVEVEREFATNVGQLGMREFKPGIYVYVGSAQRNLPARVARHCRNEKKLRWHIDYLLANGSSAVKAVVALCGEKEDECTVNEKISGIRGAEQPLPGFGASDCHCSAHLIRLPPCTVSTALQQIVGAVSGAAAVNLL